MVRNWWWKIVAAALLLYLHVGGILFEVPRVEIVNESIRNLYFHVPMWFTMIFLYSASVYYAVRYLVNPLKDYDARSLEFAHAGTVFGVLGFVTGMIWGNYTWGAPLHGDVKQITAGIALLIYFAYFVLRGSLTSTDQQARLGAVFNVFAYAAMIPLLFILPRINPSIHPGSDGNPGFSAYDLDSRMRLVFYPAVIGWCLFGLWIVTLRLRLRKIQETLTDLEHT